MEEINEEKRRKEEKRMNGEIGVYIMFFFYFLFVLVFFVPYVRYFLFTIITFHLFLMFSFLLFCPIHTSCFIFHTTTTSGCVRHRKRHRYETLLVWREQTSKDEWRTGRLTVMVKMSQREDGIMVKLQRMGDSEEGARDRNSWTGLVGGEGRVSQGFHFISRG